MTAPKQLALRSKSLIWSIEDDLAEIENQLERIAEVVQRWHIDDHDMPWRWCPHAVCVEARGIIG